MFIPINKEEISKKLDIESEGELDGSNNEPSSMSNGLSGTEDKIIEEIRDHWSRTTVGKVKEPLDRLELRFDDLKELRKANGHKTMIAEAKAKLDNLKNQVAVNSERASKDIKSAFTDLDIFKKRNKRIEPPIVKEQDAVTKSILLLVVLTVVEIFMNSQMLAPAMRGTLSTTIMLVTAISMVNILGSFLYGRLALRNFLHVKPIKNTFATIATVIFIPLLLHFNIAMGVYRGLAERATGGFNLTQMADAGRQAFWPYDNLSDATLEGGLLSIAGIIFAIIAMIDGYKFSDEYPGYGRLGKNLKHAKDRLRKVEDDALLSFFVQRKAVSDEIHQLKKRRLQANSNWSEAVQRLQSLYEDYEDWTEKLQSDGNSLINNYRVANTRLRVSPPPALFSQKIEFKIKSVKRFFATIEEHYMDDPTRVKKKNDMDALIEAEHDQAFGEIGEYFTNETEQLKARLNEIKKTTENKIHNQ